MTAQDFCYWLQGFFELSGQNDINGDFLVLDRHQTKMIMEHLKLVFNKVTPPLTTNPMPPQFELPPAHDPWVVTCKDGNDQYCCRGNNTADANPTVDNGMGALPPMYPPLCGIGNWDASIMPSC